MMMMKILLSLQIISYHNRQVYPVPLTKTRVLVVKELDRIVKGKVKEDDELVRMYKELDLMDNEKDLIDKEIEILEKATNMIDKEMDIIYAGDINEVLTSILG